MIVNLSLEKSSSKDVSIMVDALRASTTICIALNHFKELIPAFSPEEAMELAENNNSVLAGERKGKKLEGFDLGNSPSQINNYKTDKESIVLTTSNGVRVMENMMGSKHILIGSFVNAKAVAKASLELAEDEIEIVMGGYNREFAIEDFLAAGEILYWIQKGLDEKESKNNQTENTNDGSDYLWKDRKGLSEYAIAAVLASRDEESSYGIMLNSKSGKRLSYLNYDDDVKLCLRRNISENVPILKEGKIVLYKS